MSEEKRIIETVDENSLRKMFVNIIRKSIYEYYMCLKFRAIDMENTANIFSRNKAVSKGEFELKDIEKIIKEIENKWVAD